MYRMDVSSSGVIVWISIGYSKAMTNIEKGAMPGS